MTYKYAYLTSYALTNRAAIRRARRHAAWSKIMAASAIIQRYTSRRVVHGWNY